MKCGSEEKIMKKSFKNIALLVCFTLILCVYTSCGETNNQQQLPSNNSANVNDVTSTNVEFATVNDTDKLDESQAVDTITFTSSGVTCSNGSCAVDGTIVTVSQSGSFVVSGECNNGQIVINAKGKLVQLVLNNLNLTCTNSSPIFIQKAEQVVITLASNSLNTLTDTSNTILDTNEEPTATLFSKADLTINGSGTLNVNANYNNAIQSKDTLKILGGNVTINSVDDGIIGKDNILINGGNLNITTNGDSIKSTNTDATLGNIVINGGNISIVSNSDGIQAENTLQINGGNISVLTGGGSKNASINSGWGGTWGGSTNATTESAKGVKASVNITITGGTFVLDTSDDSLHCNGTMLIEGGTFDISSGDDGIHAGTAIVFTNGNVNIKKSYEGIESAKITFIGGTFKVVSSDDGINGAGGNDSSSILGRPGQNGFNNIGNSNITISGGEIFVNASGDGIDVNGNIYLSGGTVIVEGPSDNGNGALDYDGSFEITGGTLLAIGSSAMAQMPSAGTQYAFMTNVASSNKTIKITDQSGKELISYTPNKSYNNIVFSSPNITKGTVNIYINDVLSTTLNITSTFTGANNGGMGGNIGGGGMGGGGMGGRK